MVLRIGGFSFVKLKFRKSCWEKRIESEQFETEFERQFDRDPELGLRVSKVLHDYFRETTSPGLIVYEELPIADKPLDRDARREVLSEVEKAHALMRLLLPQDSVE
jgi:hypothetical protein